MYPRAHLLSIPQETRDTIYAEIVKNIQGERHALEGNPASSYDGLRLSCTQLHKETLNSVFSFGYTSHQLTRILDLKPNKANFQSVRSISIEIPFDLAPDMFRGIRNFLDRMQLSLQELRLFFIGSDGQGNHTSIHGCGKKQQFATSYDVPLLLDEGQDFGQEWELIRQTAILRNLRVLQIENANLPLSAGLLYNNKPYLKALSVTSDPRSVPSSLSRMKPSQVMQLYRNIGVKVTGFPPLRVLSLSANSAPDAEGIVCGVSQSLRHFSWRVPNPDFQPYQREKCFYSMTNRLFHTLQWRAPHLETLRLCISMREHQRRSEVTRQESESLTEELSHRLHLFPALKHLEVHYRGERGFFREHLIERLPPNLSRLYLSDDMISVTDLVTQVRRRYFTYLEDDNEATRSATPIPIRSRDSPHDEHQETSSVTTNDYLGEHDSLGTLISCGELRDRYDDIPLSGGKLGFVNFEYSCLEADDELPVSKYYAQSDRTKILRLNGQLLDRENHLHLAHTQSTETAYGIKPRQDDYDIWRPQIERKETATSSCHPEIYAAIYDSEEMAPKRQLVEMNKQGLAECAIDTDRRWDWYFGNEKEAEEVFQREPVTRAEDQRQTSSVMEVDVGESKRCRWACPDFEVPPVGSFAAPKVPVDWRDHV